MTSRDEKTYRTDAARIVAQYVPLVEPLALVFGPDAEVVLHDFSKLPNSIVAISGALSGRSVGGPATDLALRTLAAPNPGPFHIGYESVMADGRRCRSSSIHLYGSLPQRPVGSLCINVDISSLLAAREVLGHLTGRFAQDAERAGLAPDYRPAMENLRQSVDEVADDIVKGAVGSVGVPLDMMSKKQKIAVVGELRDRGFFQLRDAIDLAGTALGVSRFTIYKYLNDLDEDSGD